MTFGVGFAAGFVTGVMCTVVLLCLFVWLIDRTAADEASTR